MIIQISNVNGKELKTKIDGQDIWYNLTNIAKINESSLEHWMDNVSTKRFIEEICLEQGGGTFTPPPIILENKGPNDLRGRWTKDVRIVYKLAAWISPAFELQIYNYVKELLEKGSVSVKATNKIPDMKKELSSRIRRKGRYGDYFQSILSEVNKDGFDYTETENLIKEIIAIKDLDFNTKSDMFKKLESNYDAWVENNSNKYGTKRELKRLIGEFIYSERASFLQRSRSQIVRRKDEVIETLTNTVANKSE